MDILEILKRQVQQQPGQPSFYDRAASNPFLQTGIGILANNTGNYGAFAPALGRGVQTGLQNVNQFKQQQMDNQDRALQRALYGQQVQAQMQKLKEAQDEDQNSERYARNMFKYVGLDFDNLENDVGGFMNVSREPQPITSSPVPVTGGYLNQEMPLVSEDIGFAPAKQPSKLAKLFDRWGWSPEERDVFAAQAQADPKGAAKFLQQEMIARRKAQIAGRKEIGPKIGFEDAMIMRSQGVDVPGFEQYTPEIATKYIGQKNVGRKAAAPSAVATIGGLGEKFTEGVDKLGAQNLFEQHTEARNAVTALNAVKDAQVLLDQGMFTGRTGPWQERAAAWYQSITGEPMPKLDATQQFKTVIGDIVLPALSSLKGASSDRDFLKIEEYSRGEATMTEAALRSHLNRLFNKYGSQVRNFNQSMDDYSKAGGAQIPGLRKFDIPKYGNLQPPKPATANPAVADPLGIRR